MKSLRWIMTMPTTVDVIPSGSTGVHESCLRAYQILEYAKHLLAENTPPTIVLEIIKGLEEEDPMRRPELAIGNMFSLPKEAKAILGVKQDENE